ncbi:hypothetical protein SUGI_0934290 [Cryptomeria japonica]|nr:hypothetical protein SUGI_0934290 [Cryptomeria japonica]
MGVRIVKSLAGFLLVLNFCMYVTVACIAGWALNNAIDHHYVTGPKSSIPVGFSFSPLAPSSSSVDSRELGFNCFIRHHCLSSYSSCHGVGMQRDPFTWQKPKAIALEAFIIILSATKLFYMMVIHVGFFAGNYFFCGEKDVATTTTAEPVKENTLPA